MNFKKKLIFFDKMNFDKLPAEIKLMIFEIKKKNHFQERVKYLESELRFIIPVKSSDTYRAVFPTSIGAFVYIIYDNYFITHFSIDPTLYKTKKKNNKTYMTVQNLYGYINNKTFRN